MENNVQNVYPYASEVMMIFEISVINSEHRRKEIH
jgi:hypothetical protein